MERLLLRPSECAELIGVSRSKFYALLKEHTIASVRVGGSVRVPAGALRAWVQSQLDGPAPAERRRAPN